MCARVRPVAADWPTRRLIGVSAVVGGFWSDRRRSRPGHARVPFSGPSSPSSGPLCPFHDRFCEHRRKEFERGSGGGGDRFSTETRAVCGRIWALPRSAFTLDGSLSSVIRRLNCSHLSVFLSPPYRAMAAALFPIILCLHLTHQTVAVPAARAPAQITTRQLIELFFSSQAGGHCKNIPTLEYGFLVQVRHQRHTRVITAALRPGESTPPLSETIYGF